jgi:hypothetical protein
MGENFMGIEIYVLIAVNLAFLIGFGWPLAVKLSRSLDDESASRWMLMLTGIYFAECVAFIASVATNFFGFALAALWGYIFGYKFQNADKPKPLLLKLSLFTCLPAISLASIPCLLPIDGLNIFSSVDGRLWGIPDFIPWPFSTLLGFFAAVTGSAVLVKTFITMKIGSIILRRSEEQDS